MVKILASAKIVGRVAIPSNQDLCFIILFLIWSIRFADRIEASKTSSEVGMGLGALAGLLALWQLTSSESEGAEKKNEENALSEYAVSLFPHGCLPRAGF